MNSDKSSSDDSTDEEEVIRNFEQEAQSVINEQILPKKSADRYNLVYNTFLKWMDENKTNSFQENILICYFKDLQKKVGPATLWSIWSILKKMLNTKHNIDITTYFNLKGILKNNSKGYKPRKSLVFSWEQIMKFISDAPDYIYLGAKILLIFGICGAMRCKEITEIKYSHVEDNNNKFIVSIHDTKTYTDRAFIIGPLFYSKVKQYILLRPQDQFTDRFFIQYLNGKCHRQVMGKNKIGLIPSTIASYLKLEDASRYTGHCFRRTSATLLSESGANMPMIKQLGGWRSDTVAAGYIANSIRSKNLIFQGITHENKTETDTLLVKPSTSRQDNSIQMISSNNNINQFDGVAELQMSYKDFYDLPIDEAENQRAIRLDSSVHFTTVSGKPLSPMPLPDKNANHIPRTLFTTRTPVKLFFNRPKEMSSVDPSLSKKIEIKEKSTVISSNNKDVNKIDQVAQLGITDEDFSDIFTDEGENQENIPLNPSVNYTAGSQEQLLSVPLTNKNKNDIPSNLFVTKSPVKLFAQAKKMKLVDTRLPNKMKNEEESDIPIKDSNVKFENCTINGNIINNYYYCANTDQ